jgi:hypothetical protein
MWSSVIFHRYFLGPYGLKTPVYRTGITFFRILDILLLTHTKYSAKAIFIIYFLFAYESNRGATCVTTASGAWTSTAVWSCGAVPSCGDSVVIQAGHTVSLTSQNYTGCGATKMIIVVKGTLQFTAPGKLEMSCAGKTYVFTGGKIVPALGSTGNANAFQQCGSTWWNASAGTYNGPGCLPPTTPGCASTLPIELISFTGWKCNEQVCLDWQTATESNNAYFDLERSLNGSDFTQLQRIYASQPNSQTKQRYTASDNQPIKGLNYYRIRQADLDGSYEYFPVIAVEYLSGIKSCRIFPMPNGGEFNIEVNGYGNADAIILVQDNFGRVVFQATSTLKENYSVVRVGLADVLKPGSYLCILKIGETSVPLKLVIQ